MVRIRSIFPSNLKAFELLQLSKVIHEISIENTRHNQSFESHKAANLQNHQLGQGIRTSIIVLNKKGNAICSHRKGDCQEISSDILS